jgi:transposase
MLGVGVLILHNNTRLQKAGIVTDILKKCGWEVLPHSPHSPDKSPLDFDLFPELKEPLCGKHFLST